MGAKDSKPSVISYEDAFKRVSEADFKRLKDAFKKIAGLNNYITKNAFIKDVLGEGVPVPVAEHIYLACGGTSKGITFSNLLCGLVLLTKGREDEKIKFLFGLYSNESGTYIHRDEMVKLIISSEGRPNETIAALFFESEKVSYDQFKEWLLRFPQATALSQWLLLEPATIPSLPEADSPTFYQTLAGVTHLEEHEIHGLEPRYWKLQSTSPSGQLDFETLKPLLTPPVPHQAVEGLFRAFDQNHDQHVDFKEMACGISAACRGPLAERQKFCFKVFDKDQDGRLNDSEIHQMADILLLVRAESCATPDYTSLDSVDAIVKSLEQQVPGCMESGLTVEDYLLWAVNNPLTSLFQQLIFQVCHVVLGLKPTSRQEEQEVVMGWLQREERRGFLPGQLWYLISYDWWTSWLDYVSNSLTRGGSVPRLTFATENPPRKTASSSALTLLDLPTGFSPSSSPIPSRKNPPSGLTCARPGQIDNTPLVIPPPVAGVNKIPPLTAEGGKLKKSMLAKGRDYQLLPLALWKALEQWYGGAPALPRQVIRPKEGADPELELYPLVLKIMRHQANPRTNQQQTWSDVVGGYGAAALVSAGYGYVPQSTTPKRYVAYMAAFSRLATVRQVYEFLCSTLKLRAEDVRLWHCKDEINMVLLEEEELTLESLWIEDDSQVLLEVRNKDLTWPEEMGSLQQQQQQSANRRQSMLGPTEKGATGLNNLGNTCFMNAALQCVSNTRPLTQYFINNMHLYELNRVNPLGMKGNIAKKYGELVHEMWSGTAKTIPPLKLRLTISKYAPRFNGFQQHDSQELLAFLLDGLHEDLNRVHDKVYSELKDSAGRPDVEVAQEAWENHILRNKSIVVDLFHGQLKSKVMCRVCGHESVRFDPFNYLSLPLPMESCVHIEAIVVRLDGSVPVKYGMRLNMDSKYSAVKEHLSQLTGLPPCKLSLTEVASAQLRLTFSDSDKIKPQYASPLYAYELPATLAALEGLDDEERSSLGSTGSRNSEAQTFTRIQRMTRPPADPSSMPYSYANGPLALTPSAINTANGLLNGNRPPSESEVRWRLACMPSILCFKSPSSMEMPRRTESESSPDSAICRLSPDSQVGGEVKTINHSSDSQLGGSISGSSRGRGSPTPSLGTSSSGSSHHLPTADCDRPNYIIALHRKMIRQENYFVSWQRTQPSLFGLPLLVPCGQGTTHKALYEAVWRQVARLVSPLPPSSAPNHALDCDDSLGYEFPFVLKAVAPGGVQCSWCPWYRFCRGCRIQCSDLEFNNSATHLAIDWDPTALHLRYQNSKEKVFVEHETVPATRQKHSEPIGLTHCLEAFTREEQLSDEEKYFCSTCKERQLATKKLQIWRLPPILIVHLKRFQYVNNKWIKSQKVVEFPRNNFDPTEFLASVPKETLLRHAELLEEEAENPNGMTNGVCPRPRERVESTSLSNTPVVDGALQDFHQHKLMDVADTFKLNYKLYAIVCHTGILGGGHYVSYACNPNGKWYCYNDSRCREVPEPQIDSSSAYMLFYERVGLSHDQYMPNVEGKTPDDRTDLDEEIDSEIRRSNCVLS
ncbi:ubiquitin carboxyl-terminal hydrolase 32 [Neocloeon triangulifer]|uniref:ubiquitin carboxyl-terminal hydrolase 32 n=1 Tax=Neocloeon triangulifer TaxID=2078957 RepID=UPI00286FA899|nr:ubiquitin carboxyl-terminal hydrolase 32 [Neocloeon triangulifer]